MAVTASSPLAVRPPVIRSIRLEATGPRLVELPVPAVGPGELLLAVRCCGLCGTDLWKLAHAGEAGGQSAVLGHEVVGTVVAAGPAVVGFAAGDRVVVPHHVSCGECDVCRRGGDPHCREFRVNQLQPGGFSSHLVVGERAVRLAVCGLPDALADEAAVFLEPAACVLRGLQRSGLPAIPPTPLPAGGDDRTLAVLGAGSMGLLHLLLAKALWPGIRVAVLDPQPDRRQRALDLGADAAAAPGEEARAAVFGLAAGAATQPGADAVFDTAGGAAALAAGLELTRPGGTVVLFAHAAAGERADFPLNALFKNERRVIATYSGALAEQRAVYRLLVSGRLDPRPLVTHRLPLSRFDEAVALARDRRALKILLVPDREDGA